MKVTKRVFFEILHNFIRSLSSDNLLGLHLLGLGQALIAESLILTYMMVWEISRITCYVSHEKAKYNIRKYDWYINGNKYKSILRVILRQYYHVITLNSDLYLLPLIYQSYFLIL